MHSDSMQFPLVSPLEAPDAWRQWAENLDPASWVLFANLLLGSIDALTCSYDELLMASELIDRRDAILSELPLSRTAFEVAH